MADQTNQGIFQQFGVSPLTREEQIAAKTGARGQAAIDRSQGRSGAGGLFGALLGQKLRPSKLTSIEDQRATAATEAKKKFDELRNANPDKFTKMTQEQKSNTFQQMMANELIIAGDTQTGTAMGAQLAGKRRAQREQQLELDKLDIEVDNDEVNLERNRIDLAEDQRGKMVTVYPVESNDPNSGFDVFVRPDGVKVNEAGEVVEPGTVSLVRPMRDPKEGFKNRRFTANELGVSDKEQGEIRTQSGSIQAQARAALQIHEALKDSIGINGTVDIMDGTGKVTGAVTKVVDTLGGMARLAGRTLTVTQDGSDDAKALLQGDTLGGATKYARDNFKWFSDNLGHLAPTGDAQARAKFYSAVVRLTYAQARAHEPTARTLSDNDFKNAMTVVAGNLSNPESFRQVMIGNIAENVAALEDRRLDLGGGLPADHENNVWSKILQPAGQKRFADTLAQFNEAYSQPFGTAAVPGPGLTGGITPTQPGEANASGAVDIGGGFTLQ